MDFVFHQILYSYNVTINVIIINVTDKIKLALTKTIQKHVPLRTNLSIAFYRIEKMTLYAEVSTLFSKCAINSSKFVGLINIYCIRIYFQIDCK